MTLEQIHSESAKDLEIDETNLTIESIKTPRLFSKYQKMLSVERVMLKRFKHQFCVKAKESWEYYSGKSDPEVYKMKPFAYKVLRTEVDRYLDSDPELDSVRQKVDVQEEKVETLEKILKAINDRQWIIRNAIENNKFQAGL